MWASMTSTKYSGPVLPRFRMYFTALCILLPSLPTSLEDIQSALQLENDSTRVQTRAAA